MYYTTETLAQIEVNQKPQHRLTQKDVDNVNALIKFQYERLVDPTPFPGDTVIAEGQYSEEGIIEDIGYPKPNKCHICLRCIEPYLEFEYVSVSGGSFTCSAIDKLQFIGVDSRWFWTSSTDRYLRVYFLAPVKKFVLT